MVKGTYKKPIANTLNGEKGNFPFKFGNRLRRPAFTSAIRHCTESLDTAIR